MPFSKRLIIEYDFEFDLIGIVSHVKEYKLAWLLNNILGIRLVKQKDLAINFTNNNLIISNFEFATEYLTYQLLKNQSVCKPTGKPYYLLPELKKFDFLLMIKDESGTIVLDEVIKKIRKLSEVYYIMQADLSQLDSKENLIF